MGSAKDSKEANITNKWEKAGKIVDKMLTPVSATPPPPVPATLTPPVQYNPEVTHFTSSATAVGAGDRQTGVVDAHTEDTEEGAATQEPTHTNCT